MLRRATNASFDEVLPLVRAYHEFEGIALLDDARQHAVRTLIETPSLGGIWLVDARGVTDAAGYIALCWGFSIEFGGVDAFVDEFFVWPQWRGQGLGQCALALAVDEAKALGIRALHLEVARENERAQRFYRQAGFVSRSQFHLMTKHLRGDGLSC